MTFAEFFDSLPATERAMLSHRDEYPFTLTNDWHSGSPSHWRVSIGGKTLGVIQYYRGRKLSAWEVEAHPITITFDNPTAPRIGHTDAFRTSGGGNFLCFDCAEPGDYPIHGDDDPECLPPVCHQCGTVLAIPCEELGQAFDDWTAGRAYLDNAGNYRLRDGDSRKGQVAPWNKPIKRAYPDNAVFHKAARLNTKEGGRS